MNRRKFLVQTTLGCMACMVPIANYSFSTSFSLNPFHHGVASGDPTSSAMIIWTRVSSKSKMDLLVKWQIAKTVDFLTVLNEGTYLTSVNKDYTVKVDVTGLEADTMYFYRFSLEGFSSAIGQGRTLPNQLNQALTMAVVSCNNYEDGYFNSFKDIALQPNVDYVLHLGDYIYEYETLGYANEKFVAKSQRINKPSHELLTLDDYRTRFNLYRSDSNLQMLHQKKAFFCTWDDHEFANDTYKDGAKNHQRNEGDWHQRKQAALQAYFEWMPVRATTVEEMIRKVTIGTDCQLYFLEERLDGRSRQGEYTDCANHKLISTVQFEWLSKHLRDESIKWHILVNQVMFTGYDLPDKHRNQRVDWWTGYPCQRQEMIEVFKKMKFPPIILTGDHHQAHVLELRENQEEQPIAWEFLTPSITSKNDDRLALEELDVKYRNLVQYNPHLVYSNTHEHGYYLLKINADSIDVDYRYNTNILVTDAKEKQGPIFKITSNKQLIQHV